MNWTNRTVRGAYAGGVAGSSLCPAADRQESRIRADCGDLAGAWHWGDNRGIQRRVCRIDQSLPLPQCRSDRAANRADEGGAGWVWPQRPADSAVAAASYCPERAGNGWPVHDVNRARPAGKRRRSSPNLDRLRRSGCAADVGAGTRALRRPGWPGAAGGDGTFLQVLAKALLFGSKRGGKDAATEPAGLPDCRRGGATVYLVFGRCLSAAQTHAGAGADVHYRYSPEAGSDPRGG